MSDHDGPHDAPTDEVRRILDEHEVPPLPDDVATGLRRLVDRADEQARDDDGDGD